MIYGLVIILLLVLIMPFFSKVVEQNLEAFLFFMGLLSAVVSGVLGPSLINQAWREPVFITFAVLTAGLLFKWLKSPIEYQILQISKRMNQHVFLAIVIIILGLLSSIITAIIAAIVLVSIISVLNLDRQSEIRAVILACFSIGLGAVLTPIGEPLSTITTSKLNQSFSYLFNLMGMEIMITLLVIGVIAFLTIKPKKRTHGLSGSNEAESYAEIFVRSLKIYLFVMGLTLLGAGFEPFVNMFLLDLQPGVLYWINMISAVLDNATLAAAEISPSMNSETIRFLLFGLIISGGMLIPGNIPNIISANKLGITSKEWARFGAPFGLMLMFVLFIFLIMVG
ncbi:DUF1646 family protein [Ornithinibacillus scapharcae]|uniref:DUF1646 family protein n=1 Tax=Ornithinibacillus scapharcae TaxID=1147159 RepID=UPI000225BCEA|nr:DUF1646 family protein [Ornithinibacillus scapharcae]